MTTLQRAIETNVQFPNAHVARTKQQLRDWVLSLIESEAYIEVMLSGSGPDDLLHKIGTLQNLARRAVQVGEERGKGDAGI